METSTAHQLLNEYNFIWTKQTSILTIVIIFKNDRIKELACFLYQYSNALQLEKKNGTHVIAALDESWANTWCFI